MVGRVVVAGRVVGRAVGGGRVAAGRVVTVVRTADVAGRVGCGVARVVAGEGVAAPGAALVEAGAALVGVAALADTAVVDVPAGGTCTWVVPPPEHPASTTATARLIHHRRGTL